MSIDLTAAIEAAAKATWEYNYYLRPWPDGSDVHWERDAYVEEARRALAAAFPLVRDAIADAVESQRVEKTSSARQIAYNLAIGNLLVWVRDLQVTQ